MHTVRSELFDAVDHISPVIEAEREEGDSRGLLTDRAMSALRASGLLSLKIPAEVGGIDADPLTQFHVLERLARADGATAWCVMAMGTAGAFAASRLPPAGLEEVADGGPWPLFAGTFPHTGVVRRADGGWLVRGRWGFASGIRNADWVAGAAAVAPDDVADAGSPRLCFALRKDAVVVEDTWHVDGLQATGSTHYRLHDVFVPDARTFHLEGAPVRGGPMHRLPTLAYLTGDHSSVSVGLARRALDEVVSTTRDRVRLASTDATSARGLFQHELGRLDIALRAARGLVLEELESLWQTACATDPVDPRAIVKARAAAANAGRVAVDGVLFAHRMAGAAGVLDAGPRRRAVMDVLTATQHVYLDDAVIDEWGRSIIERGEEHA